MGYDIVNRKKESLWFSNWGWKCYLKLALDYNWQPAGTLPPHDPEENWDESTWDGSYFCNNGQYISGEDAGRIADAFQRALDDPKQTSANANATGEYTYWPGETGDPPVSRELVEFFRAGPIFIT